MASLPVTFQGTRFADGPNPVLYASPPAGVSVQRQRAKVDFINDLNRPLFSERHGGVDFRQALKLLRTKLAYRMQTSAPESGRSRPGKPTRRNIFTAWSGPENREEWAETACSHGDWSNEAYASSKFFMGAGSRWDAHSDINGNHEQYCLESDRPIAGLLADLKTPGFAGRNARWCGEASLAERP